MSVILARKILRPNSLVCIGVGEPDCLQTLEKTHGEIQNSAEESHWGISRKSVCAAGVVFSSELPPSHHSHHRHLLQSLDRLRPTKPVWSSSSCLPPPPSLSPPQAGLCSTWWSGPASLTTGWATAAMLNTLLAVQARPATYETILDTCRKLSTLFHSQYVLVNIN